MKKRRFSRCLLRTQETKPAREVSYPLPAPPTRTTMETPPFTVSHPTPDRVRAEAYGASGRRGRRVASPADLCPPCLDRVLRNSRSKRADAILGAQPTPTSLRVGKTKAIRPTGRPNERGQQDDACLQSNAANARPATHDTTRGDIDHHEITESSLLPRPHPLSQVKKERTRRMKECIGG